MCGINGIYSFSKTLSSNLVSSMNQEIARRGPDAEGEYIEENIQLGHRRLSIIDTSKNSDQPFYSEDKRYVLVFNGEIYNYKEIRNDLEGSYNFKTNGDTEVVLASFIKYGPNCLRAFNGMFAFAIWDKVEKSIFIARDRIGIKPLYYSLSNDHIIFSSSPIAILNSGLVSRKISNEGFVDYLRYQTVHAPRTILKDVKMLMPGYYIYSNEEKTEFKKYYDLVTDSQRFKGDLEEAKDLVKDEFTKSIKRRLVSDVPFGAFLSGGIDSSLVVACMSENHTQPVNTFSVSFNEDEYSEAEYARMIAKKYSTNHTEIKLSVDEFKTMIPNALNSMDHPSGDGLNTFVVAKKTKEAGIKMALSGLGGDELFCGYSVFQQVPELRRKKWLHSFPVFARKPLANVYRASKGTVQAAKIAELLKLERFDTEHVYSFYRTLLFDSQIRKILNTSEQLPINRVYEITHHTVGYETEGWRLPDLSKISVAEMQTYMSNVLLRDTDIMTMANGLEVRVPFLDHELIGKVLGISDNLKNPTTPKRLLVEAFEDKLPKEIYDRKKMGFVLPYNLWMKDDLKDVCTEGLDALGKIEIVNEKEIQSLWGKFLKDDKSVTWSRIWALVTLGYWLKRNNVN